MAEITAEQAFRAGGGRRESERAPATITLEWLREQVEQLERVIRLQSEDGQLSPEAEAELARYPAASTTGALKRLGYLKHLFYVRSEGLQRAQDASPEKEAAARALLEREPVYVQLAGHEVVVTGRSYAAMAAMGAAELRANLAEVDARRAADLFWRETETRARRGRLRRLAQLHAAAIEERELQRRAWIAHAVTSDGAPDPDPETGAPAWWKQLRPGEEGVLYAALLEAGPLRHAQLGAPPLQKKEARQPAESFGALSLLTSWGIRTKIAPARVLCRDYGQVMTEMRVSAGLHSELAEELDS